MQKRIPLYKWMVELNFAIFNMSANVEKRMTLSEIGGIIVPDMGKEKEQGCDYEDSSICDRMER